MSYFHPRFRVGGKGYIADTGTRGVAFEPATSFQMSHERQRGLKGP